MQDRLQLTFADEERPRAMGRNGARADELERGVRHIRSRVAVDARRRQHHGAVSALATGPASGYEAPR